MNVLEPRAEPHSQRRVEHARRLVWQRLPNRVVGADVRVSQAAHAMPTYAVRRLRARRSFLRANIRSDA